MGNWGNRTFSLLLCAFIAFWPLLAEAATRIARFDAQGLNQAPAGIDPTRPAPPSSCIIVIRNPHATATQTVTVTASVYSRHIPPDTTNTPATLISGTVGSPFNISAGGEAVISWRFEDPTYSTPNYTQSLSCSGSIVVTDTSSTARGFLVGAGTMTVFMQQQNMVSTGGGTNSTGLLRGRTEIFQTNPIAVGEGHPF